MTTEHEQMLEEMWFREPQSDCWKILTAELERLEAIEERFNRWSQTDSPRDLKAEAEFLAEIKEKGVSL